MKPKDEQNEGLYAVGPAAIIKEKYGLHAHNRPIVHLDEAKVPEELRHLIPLAEEYGEGCCLRRGDLGDFMPDEERRRIYDALHPHHADVARWLNRDDATAQSDEAYRFMWLSVFAMEYAQGPGLPGIDMDVDAWYAEYLASPDCKWSPKLPS